MAASSPRLGAVGPTTARQHAQGRLPQTTRIQAPSAAAAPRSGRAGRRAPAARPLAGRRRGRNRPADQRIGSPYGSAVGAVSAMSVSRLYFPMRSPRAGAPDLIWPQPVRFGEPHHRDTGCAWRAGRWRARGRRRSRRTPSRGLPSASQGASRDPRVAHPAVSAPWSGISPASSPRSWRRSAWLVLERSVTSGALARATALVRLPRVEQLVPVRGCPRTRHVHRLQHAAAQWRQRVLHSRCRVGVHRA